MTGYDITEITDARFMGLMCPPASPEARALVGASLWAAKRLQLNDSSYAFTH